MNTRLLKINAMKRFARWLDTNRVALHLWDEWCWNSKVFMGLVRRDEQCTERDKFCRDRKRPGFEHLEHDRSNQGSKAYELLRYIEKRYEYKQNR